MNATSGIWIIARKGRKKKVKSLKIDLLLSISINLSVAGFRHCIGRKGVSFLLPYAILNLLIL